MLIAAVSSSATFAQPLALLSEMISVLTALNHFATVLFGLTTAAIFLLFPKPLISDGQYWLFLAAGAPLLALYQFRLLGSPSGLIIFCFLVVIAAIGLVTIQFHNTRGAPHLRASLVLMGLPVIASGGIWCVTIAAYALQGQFDTMPESFIFLSFLILYVGIAVGVARFRLFDVGDWALRLFSFTAAALLFICLDAALIYLAGLVQNSAMALALLVIAFVICPCVICCGAGLCVRKPSAKTNLWVMCWRWLSNLKCHSASFSGTHCCKNCLFRLPFHLSRPGR